MFDYCNRSSAYIYRSCAPTCGISATSGGWRGSGDVRCVLVKGHEIQGSSYAAWVMAESMVVVVGFRMGGSPLRVVEEVL